jgi:hypothetical protein
VLDLFFGNLAMRDVREGGNIVADKAVIVLDR